jgi:signal transduction histidine kinase
MELKRIEEGARSERDTSRAASDQEALRLSEERYALAMAVSEEGHFDWNVRTDEVYASDRLKELLGVPVDVAYRTRLEMLSRVRFCPGDGERVAQITREILASSTTHYEFEYRLFRNSEVPSWNRVRWQIFRGDDGTALRVVGIVSDVTERKHFEEVEQELRRAQRLDAMGRLAGGIAHDFNNILAAILGYGEMAMRYAAVGTRLRRDLERIAAAGKRGRALVDRVLAFSRSGVAERVPVHVEAVVREALDQIGARRSAQVTIVPRLHAGRAAMLGDPTQVHQVVMNLESNAVHAMPEGGTLRVELDTRHFEGARTAAVGSIVPGDYIVLKVSDTGRGIPDAVLERMFDPFFTTKEVGVGTGLGLSLVHSIVTSVGGAIDVATELGKGSAFTVYLPRSGEAPEKAADEERPLQRGAGQRVLVVDDEEPLVRLATETLASLGYAAEGFTSSVSALAAFRSEPGRFDALLTDERMRGLPGSALIREIRGIRDGLPVVLMSGYLGMENVDVDVVLRKPFSARDLAASMARALAS